MRTAIVNDSTNVVVNIVETHPDKVWSPPAGHTAREITGGSIGWRYTGVSFEPPPTVVVPYVEGVTKRWDRTDWIVEDEKFTEGDKVRIKTEP